MNDLYKLYNIDLLNKYNKYFTMFDNSNTLEVLPDHTLKNYKKDEEDSKLKLRKLDVSFNYVDIFAKKQKIFNSLFPAKINKISYKVFKELEKNETLISNLNSFKPAKGYSKVVEYDQVKTITGRLINKHHSPKILTLPARHRKIFESRWIKEGELLQVDFKSLEPRVIRKINKKEFSFFA